MRGRQVDAPEGLHVADEEREFRGGDEGIVVGGLAHVDGESVCGVHLGHQPRQRPGRDLEEGILVLGEKAVDTLDVIEGPHVVGHHHAVLGEVPVRFGQKLGVSLSGKGDDGPIDPVRSETNGSSDAPGTERQPAPERIVDQVQWGLAQELVERRPIDQWHLPGGPFGDVGDTGLGRLRVVGLEKVLQVGDASLGHRWLSCA